LPAAVSAGALTIVGRMLVVDQARSSTEYGAMHELLGYLSPFEAKMGTSLGVAMGWMFLEPEFGSKVLCRIGARP
jgi:hypothetical protein